MSVPYITKEKYRQYVEFIEASDLDNEMKVTMMDKFRDIFKFDPNRNTYSKEKYHKDKEAMLKKTNGERAYSQSTLDSNKRYSQRNREELNRKERERYQKKKEEMLNKTFDVISI